MKKLLYALMLSFIMAASCHADTLRITATIFPIYDWIREITKGTETDIKLLLDSGADLHSYNPSVDDIVRISTCDVFIYVGGESDEWVKDALKNVTNKNQIAVNLLDVPGDSVRTEEIIEGMQHEHEHEHEESDEHVWLSLRNAEVICRYIAAKLSELDPEHKEIYASNVSSYTERLSGLDKKYNAVADTSSRKVLLFADRFPFRYMADDYGLKYYAAFSGCSAETEASFETVKFLAEKTEELKLPCVITIDGTRHKIAETVIANTSMKTQKVLMLDSMQSKTSHDIMNGASYIAVMERNLEVLKEALN